MPWTGSITGVWEWLAARAGPVAVAVGAAAGPGASGQVFWSGFEPPAHRASAAGIALAGQDGWYVPHPPGAGEWRVFPQGSSALGIDPLLRGGLQMAAAQAGPRALVEHGMEFWWGPIVIELHLAVDAGDVSQAGAEIGRLSLEPEGFSASFACVARLGDPATEEWALDLVYYTSAGVRRQEAMFEGLAAGQWYELLFEIDFESNQIWVVELRDTRSFQRMEFRGSDLYLAGGAAGGLGLPGALRLSAGPNESVAVLAIDNLWATERGRCDSDCNLDRRWDFFDFLCFQNLFAAGDPYGDCDHSGTLDFFDFLCFQTSFSSGCGP